MRANNKYWPIVFGVVIAMILSILSAAMGAVFIDNETISIGAIPYITLIVWFSSGLLCAYMAGHTGEGKWLLHSAVATLVYNVMLICVGILAFDGANGMILYGMLSSALGMLLAIFLIARKKKAPIVRKKRKFKRL